MLAFAAPHETLQETVGVVIVTPSDTPRLDLPSLWEFLEKQQQLHRSKWPSVIVFMNALPRNAANKLLRVKLGQRLNLEPVHDHNFSPLARVFDGECPKQGTALTVPIPITCIQLSSSVDVVTDTETFIQNIEGVESVAVCLLDSPLRKDTIIAFVTPQDIDTKLIIQRCQENLHRYLCPILIHASSSLDDSQGKGSKADPNTIAARVLSVIQAESKALVVAPSSPVEKELESIWRSELELDATSVISKVTSFFALGGDSLRAGRLVGVIRKRFEVPLTVADLFSFPTIEAFATRVIELQTIKHNNDDTGFRHFDSDDMEDLEIESHMLNSNMSLLLPGSGKPGSANTEGSPSKTPTSPEVAASQPQDDQDDLDQPDYDFRMKYDNTNVTTLITQILPLGVLFPLRRLLMWFVIAWSWLFFMKQGVHRFPALLLAIFVTRLVRGFVLPLLGVVCKWVIIGKYRPGRYPLFGAMYLKWWIVEQLLRILGRGFFGDESFPLIGSTLIRWYYIMMGKLQLVLYKWLESNLYELYLHF